MHFSQSTVTLIQNLLDHHLQNMLQLVNIMEYFHLMLLIPSSVYVLIFIFLCLQLYFSLSLDEFNLNIYLIINVIKWFTKFPPKYLTIINSHLF